MFSELRYRIADFLFGAELDEAFEMGLREGMSRQRATLRIKLDYRRTRLIGQGMTKTQTIGYDKAVEAFNDYAN